MGVGGQHRWHSQRHVGVGARVKHAQVTGDIGRPAVGLQAGEHAEGKSGPCRGRDRLQLVVSTAGKQ